MQPDFLLDYIRREFGLRESKDVRISQLELPLHELWSVNSFSSGNLTCYIAGMEKSISASTVSVMIFNLLMVNTKHQFSCQRTDKNKIKYLRVLNVQFKLTKLLNIVKLFFEHEVIVDGLNNQMKCWYLGIFLFFLKSSDMKMNLCFPFLFKCSSLCLTYSEFFFSQFVEGMDDQN